MTAGRAIVKHPVISLVDAGTTINELKQFHARLLVEGLLMDSHFLGQFVASIAVKNPENLDYSNRLLCRCENPTIFALNSMIRAHCKGSDPKQSFAFFNKILRSDISPDNYTLNFMVRACTQILVSEPGHQVHAVAIKRGFDRDPHVQSGLIFMYDELGSPRSASRIYEAIQDPDLVCQTAIISSYAKNGDIGVARKLFDEMPERDSVAWNAMIAGYAQCGEPKEALNLFSMMQVEGFKVNEVSMVSVLSACTQLGALDQGRWAHAYIDRNKIRMTVTLGTALVDMYAKCGDMQKAMEIFWRLKEKNVYTWSSAMNGLAMNGAGEQCLNLFSLMKQQRVEPNEVTFVSVLRGCCVIGLVEEGQMHFDSMMNDYSIKPKLDHYGCMVDLYGRAGRLDEALDVINRMPMKPHAGAWGALLHACKMYKNMELGEFASRKILELEALNHGAFVLLSNIYADSKNWESVSNLRRVMKSRGVKKPPGCSVMEVDGEVHEFFVGDKSHPRYNEIQVMWKEIVRRMKLAGYKADTSPVLFDIEEEEKEDALSLHSEKVAIAFGLISLKEGLPIRISKNLRVCRDCHDVTMMISQIFEREIIVRDRNRFHHFKNGSCSCRGFW